MYVNGVLTHESMKAIIDRGESVLHDGQIHTSHATLPAPEKLVQTADEKEAIIAHLKGEREALHKRIVELEVPQKMAEREQKKTSSHDPELHMDGYPADHKVLKEMAYDAGYVKKQGEPNPSRVALVEFLNSKKSGNATQTL